MSKLGRFLCVTGEAVLNDSVKRLYYYGKQSGTTENSAFAVQCGLQRRFFIHIFNKKRVQADFEPREEKR